MKLQNFKSSWGSYSLAATVHLLIEVLLLYQIRASDSHTDHIKPVSVLFWAGHSTTLIGVQ